ncbi:MAG: MFS transporter [Phycisphaerales bacterium]|jgi:acyl-[acyl-carrier-protein]-phospholipid O-acyltransferase/long-chain-fatty-acid--[acyl-carrier-protein] ligase|nr:MFS transporter [Phycisphaerales bacterium]
MAILSEQGGERPISGFVALLVTMGCGAINDNLLRGALLLSVAPGGLWGDDLGKGGTGWVTTMLYVPFILLLGITGQMADRYPKRRVIVWTRVVEIGLAGGVTVALATQSLPMTCVFFVLLAAQSAFFSPAKYGSVPELVSDRNLSRANGVLSMLTNMAIILGVAAAGVLLEVGPVFLGLIMVAVATVSLVSSLFIPAGCAADPSLRVSARTFTAHVRVLRRMWGTPLIHATAAWCWFYAIGSLVITIVPLWRERMELSDAAAGAMLAAPGIGIGVGGLIAGLGSGDRIRAVLIPIGAAGMTVTFVLLGVMEPAYVPVLVLLVACGIFAGFYVLPVLAMLQHLPVTTFRARTVGTANFATYLAMAASAILFGVAAPVVGGEPGPWFLGCAVAMGCVLVLSLVRRRVMQAGACPASFASVGGDP